MLFSQEFDSSASVASLNPDGGPEFTADPAGGGSGGPLTDRSDGGAAGSVSSARGGVDGGRGVRDDCLGRVCVGGGVRGDRERAHWTAVVEAPRKVVSQWQTLH